MTLETPELRFNSDKPYHRTGEVGKAEYLDRLTPVDRSYLTIINTHLIWVARKTKTSLHVLAVGSSADIQWPEYGDIDLLVCPDKASVRSEFARTAWGQLTLDASILVHHRPGSAPILSGRIYQPFQLKVFPVLPTDMAKWFKEFDLTFVDTDEGTFGDVLAFHRRNNLAFCKLRQLTYNQF